jgi:hypothetical protein
MNSFQLAAIQNAILALQQLLTLTNNGTLPANWHEQQNGIVQYNRTDIVPGFSIELNMNVGVALDDYPTPPQTTSPVSCTVQYTGARGGLILNDP